VEGRDGLRDNLVDAELDELHDHEQAGLDVLADGDNGHVDVLDAGRAECLVIGGIELNGVADDVGHPVHAFLVVVDANDVLAEIDERLGHGRPEPAETDHRK